MAGVPGWEYHQYMSSSAADMLANSKLVVLWGFDPTVTHSGPAHQFAWFIKLARERGKPVIIIDPRYTGATAISLVEMGYQRYPQSAVPAPLAP